MCPFGSGVARAPVRTPSPPATRQPSPPASRRARRGTPGARCAPAPPSRRQGRFRSPAPSRRLPGRGLAPSCDDAGLGDVGDRGPVGPGQCRVLIGEFAQRLGNEGFARHPAYRFEHPGRTHAPTGDVVVHQVLARAAEVVFFHGPLERSTTLSGSRLPVTRLVRVALSQWSIPAGASRCEARCAAEPVRPPHRPLSTDDGSGLPR